MCRPRETIPSRASRGWIDSGRSAKLAGLDEPPGDPRRPRQLSGVRRAAEHSAGSWKLAGLGQATEFIVNQFRHGKTILALGSSEAMLPMAGVQLALPSGEPDPGVVIGAGDRVGDALDRLIEAVGRHRHPARETDPPMV